MGHVQKLSYVTNYQRVTIDILHIWMFNSCEEIKLTLKVQNYHIFIIPISQRVSETYKIL